MPPRRTVRIALAVLLLAPAAGRADERYFIILFGSQSEPRLARFTHSWAALVKATGAGADPNRYRLEYHTISWLPATLRIRSLAVRPERGVNLELHATLRWALQNQRVSQWGPYEIPRGLYERALAQVGVLESGQILYRALDGRREGTCVSDCVHALTGIDPAFDRDYFPLIRFGESASYFVVNQLFARGRVLGPCNDHSWLNHRLGLDRYPIIRRQYDPGRPSPLIWVP